MKILNPYTNYVPILKAKKGELSALKELNEQLAEKVVPLLEVPKVKWDYFEEQPAETTKELLNRVIPYIGENWGEKEFYLDVYGGPVLNSEDPDENVAEVLAESIHECKGNLNFVPVMSFDYPENYQASLKKHFINNEIGCALRVNFSYENMYSKNDYDAWVEKFDLDLENTDLILDLESVYGDSPETVYFALRLILAETPYIDKWRNVIVAASSFPKSVGQVVRENKDKRLERSEWLGWKKLTSLSKLSRVPIYADYGVSHPEIFDDIDPRHLSIYASIRYTLEEEWLIIRGRRLKESKDYNQFREISEKLAYSEDFHGTEFSWGDKYISDCMSLTNGTGNLTTWRQVGNNQHIEYVMQQLANLTESS